MDITFLSYGLPGIVAGLAMHEYAHALAADALGDDTARHAGRLTPEPWVHLDLLGTLLIALVGFGWGKPVPVNPYNMRHPRRDFMLVALAGPVMNIILAFVFGVGYGIASGAGAVRPVLQIMQTGFIINANLAAFNLIPLHPLDGSKVLSGLLPQDMANMYDGLAQVSPLIVAVLLSTNVISPYLTAVIRFIISTFSLPGITLGRSVVGLF